MNIEFPNIMPDAGTLAERLLYASIEVTVFAFAVLVLTKIIRVKSPRVVAILWLMVLIKPLLSLAIGAQFPVYNMNSTAVRFRSATISQERLQLPPVVSRQDAPMRHSVVFVPTNRNPLRIGFIPIVLSLWLTGVAFALLRVQMDRRRAKRLARAGCRPSGYVMGKVLRVSHDLGLRRPPMVIVTHDLETPAIVGFLSPVVLIPYWMTDPAHHELLLWSLRHELTHWKLGDTLANGIRRIVSAVFFFHPVVWYAGRKWEEYAELACDRALIAGAPEGRDYAEALYRLLNVSKHARFSAARSGLFAARTQIGRRISALLSPGLEDSLCTRKKQAALLLAFGAFMLFAGIGPGKVYATDGLVLKFGESSPRSVNADLEETDGDHAFHLRANGVFIFTGNSLLSGAPKTFAYIEDRSPGHVKRFDLKDARGKTFTTVYTVDGKEQSFDSDASAWLRDALSHFRSSGLVNGWRGLSAKMLQSPEADAKFTPLEKTIRESVSEVIANEINGSQIVQSSDDEILAKKIAVRVADDITKNIEVTVDKKRINVTSPRDDIRERIRAAVRAAVKADGIQLRSSTLPDIDEIIERVSESVSKLEL